MNRGEPDLETAGDEALGNVLVNGERLSGSAVDDSATVLNGLHDELLGKGLDTSVTADTVQPTGELVDSST